MGNQGDRKRMSAAYSYALTRLTLNYYGFCLDLAEDQNPSLYGHELVGQVHRLLAEYLNGVSILEKLKMFRERIRKEMEVLTSYADCFQIYEYAVNRLERRFEEKPELPDDALFVKQFCNYLSDAQDSQVLYFRLQMMLEQLPIRLTKAKFFSLLMEGLSLYQDAGRSSLDQRLYMLRSGSMIGLPESMKDGHEAMYQDLKFLEQLDFKALTEQTYHQAAQMIREHAETLTNETYFLEPVQDLINDLYVLCLTRDSAIRDAGEEAAITQILLQMSHACSEGGNSLHALEELEETLYLLEGKQELYYERFLNAPFFEDETQRQIEILLSDSSFASLEAEETDDHPLSREEIEQAAEGLFREYECLFAALSKPVVRAIMARALAQFPNRFRSLDQISEYMLSCLASCSDQAEKETSKELISDLMELENAFL